MQNQTISCPKCGNEFELSESFAHPILEAARAEYEGQLQKAKDEATKAKDDLAKEKSAIETQKAQLETLIAKGVADKRVDLEKSIREELQVGIDADVKAKDTRIQKLISDLGIAKAEQLKLEQTKQDLELKASSIELEITKGVNSKLGDLKAQATKDAEESYKFKIAELEKKLTDTTGKLDEAKKKAEQGSQQLQGEVLELDFEASLTQAFPWDSIEEVKKGQRGADCLQAVMSNVNLRAGTILWETKRAQSWGGDWIKKLKADSREAKADIAVIVSDVLPQGNDSFGLVDGVWAVKQSMAIPLAHALRESILKTAEARNAAEGKQTKAGIIYDYVTGPEFRARLEGIAEPFKQMQSDLISERRVADQRFAKRQKQMDLVLKACFGMVGDLQGIAGKDLAELEAIELRALESGIDSEEEGQ